MQLEGFLNIDKSAGPTSHDVVHAVRRLAGQRRVGHGGTLDPAATGVLPVALGTATRLLEYLVADRKRYRATIRLGLTTATDDLEGQLLSTAEVPPFTRAALDAALQHFRGTIDQVPPRYSAIQIDGRRMYEMARAGVVVDVPPRQVTIDQLQLLDWSSPDLSVDIHCGKGTYIRAIARDLGAILGCGATLAALRRTAVGPLTEQTAVSLAVLQENPERLAEYLLPPRLAVADWPLVVATPAIAQSIINGQTIVVPELTGPHACAITPDGHLLALLEAGDEEWQPTKVFAPRVPATGTP
ncbi:MAG: tRNA pseudouridine(55) synthase TruB [Herpetosiphon sp.]